MKRPGHDALEFSVEHRVGADLAEVKRVRGLVENLARSLGFDESDRYSLKLATSEVVANAIEHGARPGSGEGLIRLCLGVHGDRLVVEVADKGVWDSAGSAVHRPERGRGLAFVYAFMDKVEIEWRHDGTVVRFSKQVQRTE